MCRVVPKDQLLPAALEMAEKIASFSRPCVAMAKETVNASYELTLAVILLYVFIAVSVFFDNSPCLYISLHMFLHVHRREFDLSVAFSTPCLHWYVCGCCTIIDMHDLYFISHEYFVHRMIRRKECAHSLRSASLSGRTSK